jgi:hypothetical protein
MEEQTITLGRQTFQIGELTLGQMKQVGPCFVNSGIDTVPGMNAQLTIIWHGIKTVNPKFTMEELEAIRGVTISQISAAVRAVGRLCGLDLKEPEAVGETMPAPLAQQAPA